MAATRNCHLFILVVAVLVSATACRSNDKNAPPPKASDPGPSIYVDGEVVAPLEFKGQSIHLSELLPEKHQDPSNWASVAAFSGARKIVIEQPTQRHQGARIKLFRDDVRGLSIGLFRKVSPDLPKAVAFKARQPTQVLEQISEVRITTNGRAAEIAKEKDRGETPFVVVVDDKEPVTLTAMQVAELPRPTGRRRVSKGWEVKSIVGVVADVATIDKVILECREEKPLEVTGAELRDATTRYLIHRNRRGWLRLKVFRMGDGKASTELPGRKDVVRFVVKTNVD